MHVTNSNYKITTIPYKEIIMPSACCIATMTISYHKLVVSYLAYPCLSYVILYEMD